MMLISRSCLRRALAGILLTTSGLCFSGYIILDTTIYTGKFPIWFNRTVHVQRARDSEPYDVIVLTYMRSGSSFIGKLVGFRDDTFYWYEPLWVTHKWQFHSKGQMICNYGRDGCKNVGQGEFSFRLLSPNNRWIIINLSGTTSWRVRLDCVILLVREIPGMHGATGQFFHNCRYPDANCKKCVQVKPPNCRNCTARTKCDKCPLKSVKDCYHDWIKRCNTTKYRATKVLRMDTSHAHYLLENHKRLKLIQVLRDPRAVMSSRKSTGWYYRRGYSPASDAKVLCKRMENDMASAEKLKAMYPDRVKIIQYEDFYDPNRTARILFDFLNMKTTDYVKTNILGPLYATKPKDINSFHPDSYRYKYDPRSILITNKYCQNVFRNLGLRMFNNTREIKNKNLSIILDSIRYPLE